jgi:hypothetical protein
VAGLNAYAKGASLGLLEPSSKAFDENLMKAKLHGGSTGCDVCAFMNTPASSASYHTRKYADGELDKDRSFYFRGPEGRLKLRTQNLALFLQFVEGAY